MKENFLTNIPDKRVDKNTTSLKFKEDVIDFFYPLKLKNCIEIGTSKGYSTRILSFIFENVITVDIDINNIQIAKFNNNDRNNIDYLHGDSVLSEWIDDIKFDMAFIDADHRYHAVINDAQKSIKCGVDGMYIVFDDYGLPESVPAVKMAVDEMINSNILQVVKYIGEPPGSEPRLGRPLVDWEGIICKSIVNL